MPVRDLVIELIIVYLFVINVVTFIMYGIDKKKARTRGWRVSETALLVPAIIGGAWGAGFGMLLFHHKTQKKKFYLTISIVLIVYMAALYFLSYKIAIV